MEQPHTLSVTRDIPWTQVAQQTIVAYVRDCRGLLFVRLRLDPDDATSNWRHERAWWLDFSVPEYDRPATVVRSALHVYIPAIMLSCGSNMCAAYVWKLLGNKLQVFGKLERSTLEDIVCNQLFSPLCTHKGNLSQDTSMHTEQTGGPKG